MLIDELTPLPEDSMLSAEERKQPEQQTLEVTYWLFDEIKIPNMVNRASKFVEDMEEKYDIKPADIDGTKKIFEARYEVVKFNEDMTYSEAIIPGLSEVEGFIDFLSGVPYGAVEMKPRIWELSTKKNGWQFPAIKETGAAAPVPDEFFDENYNILDVLFNYLYMDADSVDAFIDGLASEEKTDLLWWTRENLVFPDEDTKPQKYPIPGEFFALGVRMFPSKPWGDQESSPFMFSGNWFDTLYYTTAIVKEISEPTETRPFRLYKVAWRGKEEEMQIEDYNKFWARPSGFEEYKVDDRVAVLKDAATERTSQTWKDDQEFDVIVWRLAPITFYEKEE